jgi:hypothetical protein
MIRFINTHKFLGGGERERERSMPLTSCLCFTVLRPHAGPVTSGVKTRRSDVHMCYTQTGSAGKCRGVPGLIEQLKQRERKTQRRQRGKLITMKCSAVIKALCYKPEGRGFEIR